MLTIGIRTQGASAALRFLRVLAMAVAAHPDCLAMALALAMAVATYPGDGARDGGGPFQNHNPTNG